MQNNSVDSTYQIGLVRAHQERALVAALLMGYYKLSVAAKAEFIPELNSLNNSNYSEGQ
jgi:hypothetical protein